jgi:16S rRNA (cytosine1402-N4)-methyltransferase
VLLREVVSALASNPRAHLLDVTVGGGGHASSLLASLPSARLLGIDRDSDAVAAARAALTPFESRAAVAHARFSGAAQCLERAGFPPRVDGLLCDAGISSHQIDTAARGFSYRAAKDGPLDMRMEGGSGGVSAAEIIARAPEAALARVLADYGEEPAAGIIARAIVSAREREPITRTHQLAEIVERVTRSRKRGPDAAAKTFQALRIAVNDEMGELAALLGSADGLVAVGGALAVITFHSLEARLVKRAFARLGSTGTWVSRPLVVPTAEEVAENPRARSAQLRVIERVG